MRPDHSRPVIAPVCRLLPANNQALTMKLNKSALAAGLLAALASTLAQAQIGGSIDINKPGVYGRIDIGPQPGMAYPQPVLIYPQPVVIEPTRVAVYQRPMYLYVPPGHAKDWSHHCKHYNACGQPVYFVQESWVRERYVAQHSHDHDHDHDHDRKDHGRGHGHDEDRDDHHEGHDEGHGHGHGHDK